MYVVGHGDKKISPPARLYLYSSPLPWVKKADHLGHLLGWDARMEHDGRQKLAQYIDESVKMRENF